MICIDGAILPAEDSGIAFALDGTELRVGRGEHCNLRLPVRQVSRYHARLFLSEAGWGVEDLSSTNGVFVNGRRLSAARLRDGDDIRFGPVAFRYAVAASGRPGVADALVGQTALDLRRYAPAVRRDPGLLVLEPAAEQRAILIQAGMRAGYGLLFGHGPSLGDDLQAFDPRAIVLDLTQRGVTDLEPLLGALADFAGGLPILPVFGAAATSDVLRERAQALGLRVVEALRAPVEPDSAFAALVALSDAKRSSGRRDVGLAPARRKPAVLFMPRIEIDTGRVVGAEAVVPGPSAEREGGFADSPGALAEREADLAFQTLGALHQITELLREVAPQRPDFAVALDLPAACVLQDGFADRLVARVDGRGIDPSRIVLGVGDLRAVADRRMADRVLRQFRQYGFGLSAAEVRIGQALGEEWHPSAFTEFKLDPRLIASLLDDRHAATMIRTAVGAARQLGLKTVAAGVDSPAHLSRLRAIGCDLAQGYLIGRPTSRGEFLGWLASLPRPPAELAYCSPCRPAEARGTPCRPAEGRGRRPRREGLEETAVPRGRDDRAPSRLGAGPAIAEFLAAVSHELRTPLNAILGFSEIMESELFGPLGNDRYRAYAGDIRASGSHLHQIVSNLLDLYESERFHAGESTVPVRDLVAACVQATEPQAKRRGVVLDSDVAPGIPGLWADEDRLRQILVNLIGNAVKSASSGGRVTVGARRTVEGGVALWVADTTGERQATPAKEVLLPCCDGVSSCPKRSGCAGVDLPLTKALAEAHGAELHLDGAPGAGATATVTFPADRIDPARAA